MANPFTSLFICAFALSLLNSAFKVPWTMGKIFCSSGLLWALKHLSNHLVVLND